MHAFPDGPHDDAVDATSDAFAELSAFRETAPARTTILRTERTAGW
jgi:phage terminase large subunit-like protein